VNGYEKVMTAPGTGKTMCVVRAAEFIDEEAL
jgi:hypothetical protein